MLRYTIRRLLGLIPVIFGISLVVFLLLRIIPGDITVTILGERATEEQKTELRQQMGLDRPLFLDLEDPDKLFDTQYFKFMGDLLQLELGESLIHRRPVLTELKERFPATVELSVAALIIAVLVGIPLGIIAAIRRGTATDASALVVALLGVSIPIFWLGLMFQYVFAIHWEALPISTRIDSNLSRGFEGATGFYTIDGLLAGRPEITINALKHLIMPSIVLATVPLAIIARMTRSSMLEVLGQDYIRTARAKGLRGRIVILRHALRNALLPVVTVIGLQAGLLLSGAILTETVFSWPGLGTWLLEAILGRDYPIVQGGVIFVALVFVFINLLVDLSYAFLDPRIHYR